MEETENEAALRLSQKGETVVPPTRVRAPKKPSQKEIDQHNIIHLPCRAWCEICVESRGRDNHHKSLGAPLAEKTPRVEMGYDFLKDVPDLDQETALSAVEVQLDMGIVSLCQTKGSNDKYVIKAVLQFLEEGGLCGELVIRTSTASIG